MLGLRDTLGSAILRSTLRCGGVLFRQAESMSTNILMMLDSLWKSCVIWLHVRGKPFQIVCSTMQPAYGEHDTTGSSNGADSLPWLTRLVCPLYSLPTVQLTSNGQNWHASSALTTLNAVSAATKLYWRIQPLQIASSTIASRSPLKHSMLVSLVLLTTGCVLSGSIVAARMYMA